MCRANANALRSSLINKTTGKEGRKLASSDGTPEFVGVQNYESYAWPIRRGVGPMFLRLGWLNDLRRKRSTGFSAPSLM